MLLVFQMMVLWLHKVLLQLQFSSYPAAVGVASNANDAAQAAIIAAPASVGAAPAANGAAPASVVASSASTDVGPAAVGATSSQVAASPTLNASCISLCYTIMLLLLRPFLLLLLLILQDDSNRHCTGVVADPTEKDEQHRPEIPPPLLRHFYDKDKNPAFVFKIICSNPKRHLYSPHLSNYLYLWPLWLSPQLNSAMHMMPYIHNFTITTYSAMREKSNKCKYLFL